jgi:hypothetical protein
MNHFGRHATLPMLMPNGQRSASFSAGWTMAPAGQLSLSYI